MSRLKRLIQEIHRRSLWQVLGIYVGGAWVALQGIEALVSVLGLPEWVPGVALVALIVGLPIVLATAFVQEGVGAGEAPAEAAATSEADGTGLHLVLTWRNVVMGAALIFGLAGVSVAGWLLLGGEISRSPETIRSIAVLPLENLTGDPGQEYFADGMTEAVISEFARLGALSVISRTSVMRYKQSDKSLPEIAQELKVQGIVEGSVFRSGDQVRITVQLIDARNDLHLWAQTYERDLSDVLALQSDVARTVAEQIHLKLTPQEMARLSRARSTTPAAYDAYLRWLHLRGPGTTVRAWGPSAIKQLERAVELDPNFLEGWAALAGAHLLLGLNAFELRYRDEFSRSRAAAQRALEIDESLGSAHSVLGMVRLYYDWDFPAARRAFERAMQLNPNDPSALSGYAWYLLVVEGATEEGRELMERLLRVAPLDVFRGANRFRYFYYARQYKRALKEVERVRELDPDVVDMDIGNIYFSRGRIEEGYRAFMAFWDRCGDPCDRFRDAQEQGWAKNGPEGWARANLEVLTSIEGMSPWNIALVYTGLGEIDEAFAWLERGYRERDPLMVLLRADARFDPLRSDPRYHDLVRRIGFPEE